MCSSDLDVSLDELADKFNCTVGNIKISSEYLVRNNFINMNIIDDVNYIANCNDTSNLYDANKLFALFIYDSLTKISELNSGEISEIISVILENSNNIQDKSYNLIIQRKVNTLFYYITSCNDEIIKIKDSVTIHIIKFNDILEKISFLR